MLYLYKEVHFHKLICAYLTGEIKSTYIHNSIYSQLD